jgi:DNA-directed RNA polymerase specialized sigma subunit
VSYTPDLLTAVFEQGAEERLELVEERSTIAAAQAGSKEARERLILAYAPALRAAVSWYRTTVQRGLSPEDIQEARQAALLGLLEAVATFDLEVYERLAAIVAPYIRNQVASLSQATTQFSIPERTLTRFWGILREAGGDANLAADLAPTFEMRRETFLAVLHAVRDVESLDAQNSSGSRIGGSHVGDTPHGADGDLWDRVETHPLWEGNVPDVEDRILVKAAFSAVDTFEGDIVRMAYGFEEFDPIPDAEIAHRFGFSRPKVQRVRSVALGKMRSALGVA